jgi:serine O-acetyltransferase
MWTKFKQDALRWVVPGQIADPAVLTWQLLLKLLYYHLPLRAMAWYRLACWCKEQRIPLVYGMILRRLYLCHGLEIWGNIDGGLYIPHPVGTVIGVKQMGRNCSVIAAVTIGMREEWAFPTIGDNVFIGAGARVLGDICIGDNAKVGANAVVLHDVPATETVVGAPARVVSSRNTPSTAPIQAIRAHEVRRV